MILVIYSTCHLNFVDLIYSVYTSIKFSRVKKKNIGIILAVVRCAVDWYCLQTDLKLNFRLPAGWIGNITKGIFIHDFYSFVLYYCVDHWTIPYICILILVAGIIKLELISKLTSVILIRNCSITNCLSVINLIFDILLIAHHSDFISVSISTIYFCGFICGLVIVRLFLLI